MIDTQHNEYPIGDELLVDILSSTKTIALVGASANETRASYQVMRYLLDKGYVVLPVNPGLAGATILGQRVYPNLATVPAPVDLVDIFRNSAAAYGVVKDAVTLKDVLAIRYVWMQLGVSNTSAAEMAAAARLTVVMDRCPKIEYSRLASRIRAAMATNGRARIN